MTTMVNPMEQAMTAHMNVAGQVSPDVLDKLQAPAASLMDTPEREWVFENGSWAHKPVTEKQTEETL